NETKQHIDEKQWSAVVYFDRPRCILCYRCVRICSEGMGVGALGIINRGVVSEIAPNERDHLNCDQCGMCIDICPVGALTSGTYRYRTRPWEMEHVGTICTHCSDGCKTTLGVRNNTIIRANNRDRSGINGEFLCAKGRFGFDFSGHADRLQTPLLRVNGKLEPVSWTHALKTIARKFQEVKDRGGEFGVIGSNHTTNEENFYLQKFARQGLGTNNIDHHRTGDVTTLVAALSGKQGKLATAGDLYDAGAVVILGSDLSQQHPFLAFQIRANYRHHQARIYPITPGPVREDKYSARSLRVERGGEVEALESLRDSLKAETDLVVLFGDSVQGEAVRKLVDFGESLGIPVKYVALVDYSNSRGAIDMGLAPEFAPGTPGLPIAGMLASATLDVLWVVGANPLKNGKQTAGKPFIVVQDLFPTETVEQADVVLPAGSAYEKHGTVTNVCGQVQMLKKGVGTMGTKTDLEIFSLLAKELKLDLGPTAPEAILNQIRQAVKGYNVPLPVLATGGAAGTAPVNGRAAIDVPLHAIYSNGDTLYTSGTLGRYSKSLTSLLEYPGELYSGKSK
ncbi:MAG: molybdopterin-dependent oxidoreductase, partial [Acidobacteria bacterium]|nr:molybdopterin-dependent oxidoreductase [Acidobacteriota bacterium]